MRTGKGQTYTTATSVANAVAIPYKGYGGFYVSALTGSGITSIQVYAQAITGGEYTPCGDARTGTAPYGFTCVDAFGSVNVKLVANAAGAVEIGFSD